MLDLVSCTETSIHKSKGITSQTHCSCLYSPKTQTKISAGVSSFGHGAVLLQEQVGNGKLVAYASWSVCDTERRYAQIEKETLSVHFSNIIVQEILGLYPWKVLHYRDRSQAPGSNSEHKVSQLTSS